MIPRWIHDDAPASERRVFEELERDPAAGNWTVLHSLGLARRRTGPYGEIDFVVIIPDEGIFCLEVKGGGVSCQNGIWRTRNRHGAVTQIKSPFMQARDNMFALRDSISETLLVLLIADTPRARGVWEPRFQEMARRATTPAAGSPGEVA